MRFKISVSFIHKTLRGNIDPHVLQITVLVCGSIQSMVKRRDVRHRRGTLVWSACHVLLLNRSDIRGTLSLELEGAAEWEA